jgi:hypothetical protein
MNHKKLLQITVIALLLISIIAGLPKIFARSDSLDIYNDSEIEKNSEIFPSSSTAKYNEPPEVEIIRPKEGAFYINDNEILLSDAFPFTFIIGDISIEVNAIDDDSGIEKVDFHIYDFLNLKVISNTDTTEPYILLWTRDRIRIFHLFLIEAVAYDIQGASARTQITVIKYL